MAQRLGRLKAGYPLFNKTGDLDVKIFNRICSIIVIFTTAALILTFSQNLLFRSAEVYGFYFNDSRAVSKIYTNLTSSEMADEIAGFMGSFRPEKFEVLEDTGYDMENVFNEEESVNMMAAKRLLDISGIIFIISLIVTVSIYVYFYRDGKKKVLSDMFKISMGLVVAGVAAETALMATNGGRSWISERMGLLKLGEDSQITVLLGADFLNMAAIFLVGLTLIVLAVCTYVNHIVTKPPRIFY